MNDSQAAAIAASSQPKHVGPINLKDMKDFICEHTDNITKTATGEPITQAAHDAIKRAVGSLREPTTPRQALNIIRSVMRKNGLPQVPLHDVEEQNPIEAQDASAFDKLDAIRFRDPEKATD